MDFYDIARRIIDFLTEPSTRLVAFENDVNEGLPFPENVDKAARRNLISLSLVSKAWSLLARQVLGRHIVIGPNNLNQLAAFASFLKEHPSATSVVRTAKINMVFNFQEELRYKEELRSAWVALRLCTNLSQVQLPRSALPSLTAEPFLFPNITRFHCLGILHAQKSYDLVPLLQFLGTLPALRYLAITGVRDQTAKIDHIPFPTFQLETLSVISDFGVEFRSYLWLLRSSSQSLRSLHLHRIKGECDLGEALRRYGSSIQYLYINDLSIPYLPNPSIIALCPNLRSLKRCINKRRYVRPHHHRTYRTLVEELTACARPLEHLHLTHMPSPDFATRGDVRFLAKLVETHPVLRELRKLCLVGKVEEAVACVRPRDMAVLRIVCERRNIEFNTVADEDLASDEFKDHELRSDSEASDGST